MTNIKALLFLSVFSIAASGVRASEVGRAGQAGSFARMGVGARAMAMGGGSSALADDAAAAYYNPAGLVFLENRQVGLTLNSMALDRRLMWIGYAQSFGSKVDPKKTGRPLEAGFSLAWLSAGVDNIDGRDFDGNHTQTYSNWENAFYFSFAVKPDPRFSFGFSLKILWSTFPHMTDNGNAMSATGVGFDVGMMAKPLRSVTVGVAVHDLHSRYTWDSQKLYERGSQTAAKFPQMLSAGASWQGFSDRLLATGSVEKIQFYPARFSGGVQYAFFQKVFLRAGIRNGELTFGAGIRQAAFSKQTELDYAYVDDPVAPRGNHVFSFSFLF
jgi:long-subunit fatty acid transport protein